MAKKTGYHKMADGTCWKPVAAGIVLVRGHRQLFIIAKSVDQMKRAKSLMAVNSFDKLYKAGKRAELSYTRVIHIRN